MRKQLAYLGPMALIALCLLANSPVSVLANNPFFSGDSYTTELTDQNFNLLVGGEKNVVVEFYAPWCAHCKRFAPLYELVGQAFERERRVVIARLDAMAYPEIKEHFQVTGFPTFKFFPANQEVLTPADFTGSRTAPAMVEWINKQAGTGVNLKGDAARANKVPTLTPESKERMKERWQKNMAEQRNEPAKSAPASAARSDSVFHKPPVIHTQSMEQNAEKLGIPKHNIDIPENEVSKLEQKKQELLKKMQGEASKAIPSDGEKSKKKKKKQKKERFNDEL